MTTRIALAAVAAALALPAAAAAKELGPATACGVGDCRTTDNRRLVEKLHHGLREADQPRKVSGFISLRFTARGPDGEVIHAFEQQWLPKEGLVAQNDRSYTQWMRPGKTARAALRVLTRGLQPRAGKHLDAALRAAEERAREVHGPEPTGEARVVEVFDPASAADRERDEGGFPVLAVALGALVLAGGGVALRRLH